MIAIQHTDFTIHGSKTSRFRIWSNWNTVAPIFHALGANVNVGARRNEQIARTTEMGLKAFHLDDLEEEVKDVDICINTIPSLVVNSRSYCKNARIIRSLSI